MTLSLTLFAAALAVAGQGKALTSPQLTPSEMEAFLLKAKIVDIREAGGGVTGSQRATPTDGMFTHDVHIPSVDIMKPVFAGVPAHDVLYHDSPGSPPATRHLRKRPPGSPAVTNRCDAVVHVVTEGLRSHV